MMITIKHVEKELNLDERNHLLSLQILEKKKNDTKSRLEKKTIA